MTMEAANELTRELDAYTNAGLVAELWWRDDDAAEPCVGLDRLMALSDTYVVPCGLATVPERTGEPLRKSVSGSSHVWILQHGFAHRNHAPSGSGAWELGLHRPATEVLEELRSGMTKLTQLFKERFVPVVVPPWNKIDPELLPYLPVMGYRGLSASYRKSRPVPPDGLRVADAHCDVLSWKDKAARFAGAERCVADIVEHLKEKRTGAIDAAEPTCVLTHHLEMDGEAWAFMDALLSLTMPHPSVRWLSPADIWG